MDTMVVLHYPSCSVEIFKVDEEDLSEEILRKKGYRDSDISWMRASSLEVSIKM